MKGKWWVSISLEPQGQAVFFDGNGDFQPTNQRLGENHPIGLANHLFQWLGWVGLLGVPGPYYLITEHEPDQAQVKMSPISSKIGQGWTRDPKDKRDLRLLHVVFGVTSCNILGLRKLSKTTKHISGSKNLLRTHVSPNTTSSTPAVAASLPGDFSTRNNSKTWKNENRRVGKKNKDSHLASATCSRPVVFYSTF